MINAIKEQIDQIEACEWTCSCGQENTNDFLRTTFPTCSSCGVTRNWDEVLSRTRMSYLNTLIKTLRTHGVL